MTTPGAGPGSNPLCCYGPLQHQFWRYWLQPPPVAQPSSPDPIEAQYWRNKLACERLAQARKRRAHRAEQQLQDQIQQAFEARFSQQLQQHLFDLKRLVRFSPILPVHLDLLSLVLQPQCSRERLWTLVQQQSWLCDGLVRQVNREQTRRGGVSMHSAKLAFHSLGLERLQQLIPWLTFRYWCQSQPDRRNRRLWALISEQIRRVIAQAPELGLSAPRMAVLAALHGTEWLLLLTVAQGLFEQQQQQWLSEARLSKTKAVHESLRGLLLPPAPLLQALNHSGGWSGSLLQAIGGAGLPLTDLRCRALAQLSPEGRLLAQVHLQTLHDQLLERQWASEGQLLSWYQQSPLAQTPERV